MYLFKWKLYRPYLEGAVDILALLGDCMEVVWHSADLIVQNGRGRTAAEDAEDGPARQQTWRLKQKYV